MSEFTGMRPQYSSEDIKSIKNVANSYKEMVDQEPEQLDEEEKKVEGRQDFRRKLFEQRRRRQNMRTLLERRSAYRRRLGEMDDDYDDEMYEMDHDMDDEDEMYESRRYRARRGRLGESRSLRRPRLLESTVGRKTVRRRPRLVSEAWKSYYPELDMTKDEALAYSRQNDVWRDLRDYIGDIVSYWLEDAPQYDDDWYANSGRVWDSFEHFLDGGRMLKKHKYAVKVIGRRKMEEFAYHVVDLYTGKISPDQFINDRRWSKFREELHFWWYFWGYKEQDIGTYNMKDPDIGWW